MISVNMYLADIVTYIGCINITQSAVKDDFFLFFGGGTYILSKYTIFQA